MPYRNIRYAEPARSSDKERMVGRTVFDFSEDKGLQLLVVSYSSIMNCAHTCRALRVIQGGEDPVNHPDGTHDDRFGAIAFAVYASEQVKPASRPIARTI